jgi:hypothetical protein
MARARNIKPSFFQNEELGELAPLARLAFIGMWTIADYKGCIEFRPKRLKVQLLPYDDCDMEEIAINLDKSGFVRIYSVGDQRYIKIVNFEKHQNPHKNEREAGSDIPDIAEVNNKNNGLEHIKINPEQNGTTPADSPIPLPDSLTKPSRTSALELLLSHDVPEQLAKDWLKIRKAKRLELTETTLKATIREAEKAGFTLVQAITYSCENAWGGFKAEYLSGKQAMGSRVGVTTAMDDNTLVAKARELGIDTYKQSKQDLVSKINAKLGVR